MKLRTRMSTWRTTLRAVAVLSTSIPALVVLTPGAARAVTNPVSVTMTASANPVASGSSLTYNIVATDTEPQQANVRLTDQLTGLTNVVLSSSRGYCTLSSGLVTCDAGTMPGGGSTWTVTITGLVTAGNGTYLNNTATVVGDWSPQNTSQTFSVPATTSVLVNNGPLGALPDLSVSVTAPTTATGGSAQTYQVTVNNSGGQNATDVFLQINLALDFSMQPGMHASGTSLFQCSDTDIPVITCVGGAVNAGANATITLPVVVSASTPGPNGLAYVTTAVVDPENAIVESNELNNTTQQTLTVPAPAAQPGLVTFGKAAVTAGPAVNSTPAFNDALGQQARPGDTLTYTLSIKNTSLKDTITRLQVTDGTQGLDQASVTAKASDAKLICANSNSQVKCAASNNNYTLGVNTLITVKVVGKVVQPPSSIITNTATMQGLQNKLSLTRTASVTTIVRPGIDLTLTNFATCAVPNGSPGASPALLAAGSAGGCQPFRARNQFDYLVTVGNSGLNDAVGTAVRIPLPNDVIYEGFDSLASGFACAPTPTNNNPSIPNNVVVCTGTVLGQISGGSYPGTTKQFRLHLTAPNSTGPITAITTVDPFNTLPESDETNNTFSTTTQITTGVDLVIMQSERCPRDSRAATNMCNPVAPSGTLIYDITVQNVGTQDANGIKVTDTLPVGARFRSAKEVAPVVPMGTPYTPTHNLSCSSDGALLVTCTSGRLVGIYAAYGGPLLQTSGTPDNFTIEVTAFAPAPYGPNSSADATGSPILNQVQVDPDNTIPEFVESHANPTNNLNLLETNVGIPPEPGSFGDWGTYNELTVVNEQTNPASGANVAPNGTLEYTLTVNNYGSDPVSNITVYDALPQGARFRNVFADPLSGGNGGFQCSFNAGLVTCGNGALAAAAYVVSPYSVTPSSTKIHIKLFAPDTSNGATGQSEYTNHAVVDPNNAVPEADETNNVSDAHLVVDLAGANAYNEFTISDVQAAPATGSVPDKVATSGTLVYRLTIANTGSDPATGVVVRDYLPAGTVFRSAKTNTVMSTSPSDVISCFNDNGVVQCGNGTILAGEQLVIDVTLFAPTVPGTIHNQATVNPDKTIPEANYQNDTATSADTIVATVTDGGVAQFNELHISSMTTDPTPDVATDTVLKYHLTVENTGSDQAFNVKLSDYLPQATHFVSASDDAPGTGAFTCSESSGTVNCTGGTIPAGPGTRKLTIIVKSPKQSDVTLVDNAVQITNQATVDPDNTIPEGDETNNSSSVTTTVHALVDLISTNDGSGCSGQSGNQCSWTFTVTNNGPDSVSNVVVRTDLAVGVIPLDVVAPADWACQITENPINQVTCQRQKDMASAATDTFTIRVYVTANSGESISSTTIVDPGDTIVESDESNNTSMSTQTG